MISRRTLFTRMLSALAAVPLVGKMVAAKSASSSSRLIITKIDFANKTVWLGSDSGIPMPRKPLNPTIYPAGYIEWYDRYWAYADANPERIAAHEAELRRVFPILYADD